MLMEFIRVPLHEMKLFCMENKARPCVYRIVHPKSGDFYIGSTNCLQRRYHKHLRSLTLNIHHNSGLALRFQEDPNLEFEVSFTSSIQAARECEQKFLDLFVGKEGCLNLGDSSIGAFKTVPKRVRELISAAQKGRKSPFKGIGRTEEDKRKISEATRAAMAKLNLPWKGKPLSDQHRKNLSAARTDPIMVGGVIYPGGREEVSKVFGITKRSVFYRVRYKNPRYSDWVSLDSKGNPKPKV